jgi:hypothetical protein
MDLDAQCQRDDGRREGKYANYLAVGHNAVEVLLDFGQFYSDPGTLALHTRIITSPHYAREFSAILAEALDRYVQAHGPITAKDPDKGGLLRGP